MTDSVSVSVKDTRAHLNAVAESVGVDDPDEYPNKAALIEAIEGAAADAFPDLPSTADDPGPDPEPEAPTTSQHWHPPGAGRGGYPTPLR